MPINSTHPEYKARVDQWERCRDVVEGSDAVKAKGIKYLPKLEGQTTTDYNAYRKRALFFSVAGRSLSGLVGMMTRKPPIIVMPDDMKPYFKDATSSGVSFIELFRDAANELLQVGRYGILIDWPEQGGRAYLSTITTESIINWFLDREGKLLGAVLQELILENDTSDPFVQKFVISYRHLYMDEGVYKVAIYDDMLKLQKVITPLNRGNTIDHIPLYIVNVSGLDLYPPKPPILDIVDVNLSLYITSADLEHGRHFTALPTPVVTGAPADTKLKIGSQTAWAIPSDKARAYYLEFLGTGLGSLENAIKEKTGQMAQFSTRLMDTSTRGSEAAETVKLRHSSEATTLTGVTVSLENTFNAVYDELAIFEGIDPTEMAIALNKDFLATQLSAAELRELTKAYLEGAIDEETYFYNLERGELTPETKRLFETSKASVKADNSNVGDDE